MPKDEFQIKRHTDALLDTVDDPLLTAADVTKIDRAVRSLHAIHPQIPRYLNSTSFAVIPKPIHYEVEDYIRVRGISISPEGIGIEKEAGISLGIIKVLAVRWAEVGGVVIPAWSPRLAQGAPQVRILGTRAIVITRAYLEAVTARELATTLLYVSCYELTHPKYIAQRRELFKEGKSLTRDLEQQLIWAEKRDVERFVTTVRQRFKWFDTAYQSAEAKEQAILNLRAGTHPPPETIVGEDKLIELGGYWLISRLSDTHTYVPMAPEREVFFQRCQQARRVFHQNFPTEALAREAQRITRARIVTEKDSLGLVLVRIPTHKPHPTPLVKLLVDKKLLRHWRKGGRRR